jgi:FKBP-type peptidyl-prolyl cis-trans isomerase 2
MHRSKDLTVDKDTVLSRSGKPPAVGDRLDLGKEQLPATVLAVSGPGVTVRFSPKPGMRIDTPFGRGTVRETPTDFEIVVDDPVGSMVRSGPLVGRIINLSDTEVTIDYGDPFGGEELSCDIAVEAPAAEKDKGVARAE